MMLRAVAMLVLLPACGAADGGGGGASAGAVAGPGGDACGAARYIDLVGKPFAGVEVTAPRLRVIEPGQRITMDHIPDRLNIRLDSDGIVDDVYCG